ncbi:TAT-variant-translocated molybdopterin oxidoreductase [Mucisphaera sp.]|uniref:TAT-variant-translocated molybdopterin oxidoreductase n=1 Tax=Mucisphaera sp. TaxID=2913024 RepID=UPI003D0E2AD4
MPPLDPQETQTVRPSGEAYWRSIAEYADSESFRADIAKEFPGYDPEEIQTMSRRHFLGLAGASMALAGLTMSGCRRWPREYIVPYASRPEGMIPGVPEKYASMLDRQGVAAPTLITSFDGRPIKIDGNPDHPLSKGSSDVRAQAAILEMYDPERSRSVLFGKGDQAQLSSWEAFDRMAGTEFGPLKGGDGSGIAFLSEATSSPTLLEMRARVISAYPGATWHTWEPAHRDHELLGSQQAFGRMVRPQYDLAQADVIACFESDLLADHPGYAKHARGWAEGRKRADADTPGDMNRMYVAESTFTPTGMSADERLPIKASRQLDLLRAIAARVGAQGVAEPASLNGESIWVEALVADLAAHRGRSVVVAGASLPAEAHHLAHLINERLGNVGTTVTYFNEPAADQYPCTTSLAELAAKIEAGQVEKLVILGGNPAYDATASLGMAEKIASVPLAMHLSLYANETSRLCQWHLPMAHPLECWGDGVAWDGTLMVQQPLIEPLFAGKSAIELLAILLRERPLAGYDLVRRTWAGRLAGGDFEKAWRKVVHDGFLAERSGTVNVSASGNVQRLEQPVPAMEVVFKPSPTLGDGRMANSGWLQELPDSSTKVVWDNPLLIHPADARELGVAADGDLVTLSVNGQSVTLPAFRKQGQARGSVTAYLGYGRTAAGRVGNEIGTDVYPLRSAVLDVSEASVSLAGGKKMLAMTSQHHLIGIDDTAKYGLKKRVGDPKDPNYEPYVVKSTTIDRYQRLPKFVDQNVHGDLSLQLWSPPPIDDHNSKEATKAKRPGGPTAFNDPHAWGMTIDMNACTGCNACIIACQSENNIPVVGAEQVDMSREMHWLRLDTYYKGDPEGSPEVIPMPMMCTHCENAPCEQVCPVAATVHDTEGLNTMVYNRCIGTRYCSNNCPYKVRRFNYFDYHSKDPRGGAMPWLDIPDNQQLKTVDQIKRMKFNPAVTVRMRGIMEKCTYCTQRIAVAKIHADNEYQKKLRPSNLVQEGEIITACQMACPTEAIVFGNLNDADAKVSKLQANNRAYGVLRELNTRPRTLHLARIFNPNPTLAKARKANKEAAYPEAKTGETAGAQS